MLQTDTNDILDDYIARRMLHLEKWSMRLHREMECLKAIVELKQSCPGITRPKPKPGKIEQLKLFG